MLTILLTWLLMACSKNPVSTTPPPTPPGPVPADGPVQYGTPFGKVPDAKDAVIYQVNIRAFSNGGTLKGVQARLDSIKSLGVNVIYLMPVYPVGTIKSVNSPYCIKDYGSIATEFGTLDDVRTLVAEAHNRDMSVIFDWVASHTAWDNAWIANKSWYKQDASGNIISPPNTGWNDVAALNYTNVDMRKAMIKAMKYWIYTANIDGYRCDAADFVPADFWKQALDSLKNISSHKLLLFAEGSRTDHFTAGFQLEYGFGFYYTMKDRVFQAGRSVKAIDSVNTVEYTNATNADRVVRYTSNHDVNLSDGIPAEVFVSDNGALATFIVAAYMKGVPMIYNGQEIGYRTRLNYFNNTTPITWTYNPAITPVYKKLMAFRNSSAALRNGVLDTYSSDDVCVFKKTLGTEKVLVIVNLRNASVNYTIPTAIAGSSWNDAFNTSASVTLNNQLTLAPYSYQVLTAN